MQNKKPTQQKSTQKALISKAELEKLAKKLFEKNETLTMTAKDGTPLLLMSKDGISLEGVNLKNGTYYNQTGLFNLLLNEAPKTPTIRNNYKANSVQLDNQAEVEDILNDIKDSIEFEYTYETQKGLKHNEVIIFKNNGDLLGMLIITSQVNPFTREIDLSLNQYCYCHDGITNAMMYHADKADCLEQALEFLGFDMIKEPTDDCLATNRDLNLKVVRGKTGLFFANLINSNARENEIKEAKPKFTFKRKSE